MSIIESPSYNKVDPFSLPEEGIETSETSKPAGAPSKAQEEPNPSESTEEKN